MSALAYATATDAGGPLRVVVFYSATCPSCREVKEAAQASAGRWGESAKAAGGRVVVFDMRCIDGEAA